MLRSNLEVARVWSDEFQGPVGSELMRVPIGLPADRRARIQVMEARWQS